MAARKKTTPTLIGLLNKNSINEARVNGDGSVTIEFDGNVETDYLNVTVTINGTDGCGIAANITTQTEMAVS